MQAYCVSKRPPRALYLGLAIGLGMVAVSTVVLSQMGGGLLRDGTYLRLLGYSPSNRGASLTALGAADASASHGVLSASSAPGPTPAPPRADVARSPSDAPANATVTPAPSSDRNPDPVHADVPALREVNETARDLANGSLDSFGFGVLPHDADHVRGAPDLMHFVMPSNDDGNCTWKNEYTATDANHDGHPEYVHGRMLGTCLIDANQNGIPEAGTTIARDVEVHAYQTYDIGDNGTIQYRAAFDLAASTRDANNDGHNESAQVNVTAYEALDRNHDGFDELARGIEVSFAATDVNSNGFPERVDGRIYLYGRADPNSDGILEDRKALEVTALALDSNGDGHPELARITLTGAVARDLNQDRIAEYRASLDGSLEALDENSNGLFARATLTIRAEAFVDANSDGQPEDHSFATLDGVVLNTIEDQNPDQVELHLVATQELDLNSDGLVDETRGATIDLLAVDANSNGAFESTNVTIHARAVRDANLDA